MTRPTNISVMKGCLLGGAVGDALGEPVEFRTFPEIQQLMGPDGVTGYWDRSSSPGAFTDDTQMTLWTAEGLIRAFQRRGESGVWDPHDAVNRSYRRWFRTQRSGVAAGDPDDLLTGWLIEVAGLWASMAPGNTCLSAMRLGGDGTRTDPINDSKGCGGVMRVAPVGLLGLDDDETYDLGCDLAAMTHGHPAGWAASGALALIISRLVQGDALNVAVDKALKRLDVEAPQARVCSDALRQALDLAGSETPSWKVVERLGGGWVAEEALAISVYCALVSDDFRSGVLLAVNHRGDSDSTGSITGQIMGTMLGVEAIPDEWLDGLQLRDVVERMADDLAAVVGGSALSLEDYPPC